MATVYRIQIGDEIIEFEGPDDLSDRDIEALANKELKTARPGQEFPPSQYVGDVVDPALAEEPRESSAGGSYARGVTQGGTANFGDEISAFANAAIPGLAALDNFTGIQDNQQAFYNNPEGFWAAFDNNMKNMQAQKEVDVEQHGTAQALGEVSGALATIPAGMRVAGLAPEAARAYALANPIRTGAALGAGSGAFSGYGAGTEGNRGQSAALGGLTGLALGGSLSAGMELAPAVANYARIFLGRGSERDAIRQITQALQRDGYDVTSPSGVQQLRATLQEFTGKPVSLADVGGAVRARTGAALRAPSQTQQQMVDMLNNRTSGQGERLMTDIRATVSPRTDTTALDEALVEQRSAAAKELREKALYENSDVTGPALYRGGAAFDPSITDRLPYFTPDREAADTFRLMHQERFGTPGVVEEARVNIRNPAPEDVVLAEARRLGLDDSDSLVPASNFDVELHGQGAFDLRDALKAKGYDGSILSDITYGGGGNDGYMMAHVPFDNSAVKMGGGRTSRIIDPSDPTLTDEQYQLAHELQNIARLPDAQRALKGAIQRMNAERDLLAATGQDISHLPDIDATSNLDVRTFDAIKRYLDDEVNALYKRGQGSTFSAAEAAQVRELRDSIRERLRKFVPEYGDYLDQYAGSSEMIDSLREGADFTRLSPEQIAAAQSRRSDAGQELYRVGAARQMVNTITDTGDNAFAANRILRNDTERNRLAALGISPADAARLERSVGQERQLNLLSHELNGAQRAQRSVAEVDAGRDMIPTNISNPYGFAGRFLQHIADSASLRRSEAVNQELLPRMLETDPTIIGGIITELEQAGQAQLAADLRRRQRQLATGYASGMIVGGPVAIGE